MKKIDLSSYNPQKWKDCGNYWLYDTDQRDPDWGLVRLGRITGSKCGSLLNHSNFSTPEKTINQIVGLEEEKFTQDQIEIMNFGTQMEPYGRQWYAQSENVKVEELGFVVPKWDLMIGVSVDGVVLDGKGNDGIIEIKAPKKMYKPLENYMFKQKHNMITDINNFSHIWTTHYDQMQFGMAILEKKWCDYIVYCIPENKIFKQRIPFNQKYWNYEMYSIIKMVIKEKINPLLKDKDIPLMPPIL